MNLRKTINTIGILTTLILLVSCGGSYESQDREKLISSFEDNFGFKPPKSVAEIKLKNWDLYDTDVHWMAFTYDSIVLNKILAHNQPLNIALKNSSEFTEITEEINKSVNNPEWLKLPNAGTDKIYYKKDFIERKAFSEYYLWTNMDNGITYLFVHSFY